MRRLVDWLVIVAALVACTPVVWADIDAHGIPIGVSLALAMMMIQSAAMGLTRPGLTIIEVATAFLGLIMVSMPWVLGFTGAGNLALVVWGVGAVVLVLGIAGIPLSIAARRNGARVAA